MIRVINKTTNQKASYCTLFNNFTFHIFYNLALECFYCLHKNSLLPKFIHSNTWINASNVTRTSPYPQKHGCRKCFRSFLFELWKNFVLHPGTWGTTMWEPRGCRYCRRGSLLQRLILVWEYSSSLHSTINTGLIAFKKDRMKNIETNANSVKKTAYSNKIIKILVC